MRRKITVSRQGIHFIVEGTGQINAHWNDLIGQGLSNDFTNRVIRSMLRFWVSFGLGIGFIIRGRW